MIGGLAVLDRFCRGSTETTEAAEAAEAAVEYRDLTAGMPVCPTELVQVADGPPLALFADGLDTALYRLDPRVLAFRPVGVRARHARRAHREPVRRDLSLCWRARRTSPRTSTPGPSAARWSGSATPGRNCAAIRWGVQERLSYRASDGLAAGRPADPAAGRSRDEGPFPLVTMVHGGPYFRYSDEFDARPGGLRPVAGDRRVRGLPAQSPRRLRARPRVRRRGRGRGRRRRVDRHPRRRSTC